MKCIILFYTTNKKLLTDFQQAIYNWHFKAFWGQENSMHGWPRGKKAANQRRALAKQHREACSQLELLYKGCINQLGRGTLCQAGTEVTQVDKVVSLDLFPLPTQENGESVQPSTGIFGFLHYPPSKCK